MAVDKQHLRHCILYAFQLKKNAAEATRMICAALDENAVTHKTCKKWYQRFRNGDFDLSDRQRPGQPQKFDDEKLEQLLTENSAQTQQELALQLGVTQRCISHRLHQLEMAQGKLKVKTKVPTSIKMKIHKAKKGPAIQRRGNAPVQPKKTKLQETQKLKKMITKNVNNVVEDELRQKALEGRKTLTKKN